ncbi:MAG: chemotaxis protein CheX [Clostridia bacterium]|nr:chemotaxis protein CheX [Clostridia bacterium]
MDSTSNIINTSMELALEKEFSKAVTEVINTMAGLEILELDKDSYCHSISKNDKITGAMLLSCENNPLFSITLSKDSASLLVSYITGIPCFELTPDDLCDGIAELVNMVAGRSKALLSGTEYHYELTSPLTIIGNDYTIIFKKNTPSLLKRYQSGDMVIELNICFL